MDKIRFGICGLGFMGQSHFWRLIRQEHATVTAICDRDAGRRAGQWGRSGNLDLGTPTEPPPLEGITAYGDLQGLLRDEHVDAVLIALPTALHAETAIHALDAGKHVLCEKPMAYRPGECNLMIAAAERNQRQLMIAHCLRFWPQYDTIKQLVEEGRIGRVRYATFRRLASPPLYTQGNWLMDELQSGGALLDLHIHDIDYAQYLLGLPATITAQGLRGPGGRIDHVVATYGFEDGRYATIEGGWAMQTPWPFEMALTVHGDAGTLDWSSARGAEVRLYTGSGAAESLACPGDALVNEQAYFVEAVRTGQSPERCPPSASRTSVFLAWLERRAIESGKPVPVSERLKDAWTGGHVAF